MSELRIKNRSESDPCSYEEHRTSTMEVMGLNPVVASEIFLGFIWALLHNCKDLFLFNTQQHQIQDFSILYSPYRTDLNSKGEALGSHFSLHFCCALFTFCMFCYRTEHAVEAVLFAKLLKQSISWFIIIFCLTVSGYDYG